MSGKRKNRERKQGLVILYDEERRRVLLPGLGKSLPVENYERCRADKPELFPAVSELTRA